MNPLAGTLNSTIPFVHGSWPVKNVFANIVAVSGTMMTIPRHLSPRKICARLQQVACAQTATALSIEKTNITYQTRYCLIFCVHHFNKAGPNLNHLYYYSLANDQHETKTGYQSVYDMQKRIIRTIYDDGYMELLSL